mmetsp:Transcript_10301/g.13622  ORF Transcript_10301/g.13622 Transcript_10301/m.13622 type:complete len:207 (-) Transcript_10301:483-1103(-)
MTDRARPYLQVTGVQSENKGNKGRRLEAAAERTYPVAPIQVLTVQKPRNVANHSYRDFSLVPADMNLPGLPDDVEEMPFPQLLHRMLSNPAHALNMAWMPHGRAFRIMLPGYLGQQGIYQSYFRCKNYQVFLSFLNSHGFKHITSGKDRNCFYHEKLLRGLPHLVQYLALDPPKNARRVLPDPANEPDFYPITEKYPLPTANVIRE